MLRGHTVCMLCQQTQHHAHPVCAECEALFVPLGPACQHCARPLPDTPHLPCGHCLQHKPEIDSVITALRFDEPFRNVLHTFKYREGFFLTTFLTHLMLKAYQQDQHATQCLIPIPIHPTRLKTRGFNQSVLLARKLSKALNIPCLISACEKIRNTPPQAALRAKERQQNVYQAFRAHSLPYQHITLVDDLITTGNTANEVARTFKEQGVKTVQLWCCARAIYTPHG